MAKKKLYKSKSSFTLKRLHQSGSYGNIYERDYTTIYSGGSVPSGQIPVYGSPSFKLSVRAGLNGQKKYNYGQWVTNTSECAGENKTLWTIDCMPEPNKQDTKIVLKPNTRKLTDFVCYGSAVELVKNTIKNIIANFPGELYVSDTKIEDTGIFDTGTLPEGSDLSKNWGGYIIENPLMIDIMQAVREDDAEHSVYSSLRYMCESYNDYEIIDADGKVTKPSMDGVFWYVKPEDVNDKCLTNGTKLCYVLFGNKIRVNCYYYEGEILYVSSGVEGQRATPGTRIRPNEKVINNFFENLNDFEKVLLNRYTDYTAKLETYEEDNEKGWYITEKTYKWPKDKGSWNISVRGLFYSEYITSLEKLATTCDELFTDAMWRTMTHDAICNMDLTSQNSDGDFESIDSSKIRKTLNIFGRQFDEIKKYADNIKSTNSITYDQNSNLPDYFLSDNLNLFGWETKTLLNNVPNDIVTEPMYGSRTMGYTAGDANNEFLRRLKLNSKSILSKKGTKQGIEELMSLFGFHSRDWIDKYYDNRITQLKQIYNNLNQNNYNEQDLAIVIDDEIAKLRKEQENVLKKAFSFSEYVYVAQDYRYNNKEENPKTTEEFVEDVKFLNAIKDTYIGENLESNDPMDYYEGLPVVEVSIGDKTMIVPWFDKEKRYDSNAYFQMKGGWGRDENNIGYKKYDYSVSKIHFVREVEELYDLTYQSIDEKGYYYVANIDTYYKVKDINEHNNENGWVIVEENNIRELENIIDDNKGNNPHTGEYDNGISYIETFSNLFKYTTFNNTRYDDVKYNTLYGFDIVRQSDSTKMLYFHNIYDVNSKEFNRPDRINQLRGANSIKPHNFFEDNIGDEAIQYHEASSLSIINAKEFGVTFSQNYESFIRENVLPYIKQVIPSTTIFSYNFTLYGLCKPEDIVCYGGTPIFGVVR